MSRPADAGSLSRVVRAATIIAALLLICAVPTPAQDDSVTPEPGGGALSPRNANYSIDVTLNVELQMLEGHQIVEWRNIQDKSTDSLWFHLYWNAWRNNQSTWMLESGLRGGERRKRAKGDWGYLLVDEVRLQSVAGDVDLTAAMRFASPDDGNPDDRTVMVVDLPEPVAPGETVRIEMTWRAKIPRTFARTGFRGNYFFIAHWFPKLGVYEPEGWNCHQYHSATEYYSDYGVYDVRMTVPADFVLGATGREIARQEHDNETVTHRYLQEDVHAFTWTASPDYLVVEERFEEPNLPAVDIRLLLQPEHRGQAGRHMAATSAALKYYGAWYGAYPYDHVTVVDPAYRSGAGGMEYPTLFTAGSRLFNPPEGGSPEGVTIHEAGHQFWYALVGNNEFEHAWIDEGLNTFSTARVQAEAFGEREMVKRYFKPPGRRGSGFFPWVIRGLRSSRAIRGNRVDSYRSAASSDVPLRETYRYFPGTASRISYSKTALWLGTLEGYLGWDTLQGILSTFFERWKFKHPRPDDFFAVANEIAGQDLTWFFDQVMGDSVTFDYGIDSVSSRKVGTEGWVESDSGFEYRKRSRESADEETDGLYRTDVVVRRHGEGVFPVEVLMVFEDGSEVRRVWDGLYNWKLYTEEGPSKLEYAVVDPDRVLLLDLNYTNNSRRMEASDRLPAVKWASKWMIWLQDYLLTLGSFV